MNLMNITINSTDQTINPVTRGSLSDRLSKAFTRFSNRITHVNLSLTDQNGPRGGIDKRCCICVAIPGMPPVTAVGVSDNPWAAVSSAMHRARRSVLAKLKRRQSRRTRGLDRRTPVADHSAPVSAEYVN